MYIVSLSSLLIILLQCYILPKIQQTAVFLYTPIKQNIHGSMKLQIEILIIDAELSITQYIDSFFHIMNGSFVLF